MRYAVCLTVCLTVLLSSGLASAECTVEDGRVTCDKDQWVEVRDKARIARLLCETIGPQALPESAPAELVELCDHEARVSDVWARAEGYVKAQSMAAEKEGALNECRATVGRCDKIQRENGRQGAIIDRLQRRPKRWVVWVVGAGALLVGAGSGYVVGSIAAP